MVDVTKRAVWRTGRVDMFDSVTGTWRPGRFGSHSETFDMDVDGTGPVDVMARVRVRPFVCGGDEFDARDAPGRLVDVETTTWRRVRQDDPESFVDGSVHVRVRVTLGDPNAMVDDMSPSPFDGYVAEFVVRARRDGKGRETV